MKKSLIRFAGILCSICIIPSAYSVYNSSAKIQAVYAAQITSIEESIFVNDEYAPISGYNINGNTYFKLRDLASVFHGTSSQFDVVWNKERNQVEIITNQPYSSANTEGQNNSRRISYGYYSTQATESKSGLLIDGTPVNIKAYSINGNNYYQLRELSNYIGYNIHWVKEEKSIYIYTALDEHIVAAEGGSGISRFRTVSESTSRWPHINQDYIFLNDNDTFSVFEANETECVIDTYDSNYNLLNTQTISKELETFGGFFSGKQYNYIAFGQNNKEENDSKEVIRIVKYDKDFKRLDALSITGKESFTIEPFSFGSVRMEENGDELAIHTSRRRYTTEDGLNHQSQLTIFVNTKSMKVENSLGQFQDNHVSHSFGQFVQYDENQAILVDLGDAYPRSVVLHKGQKNSFQEVRLFDIPGNVGANCTGITLGGLAISKDNYLVAINSINHTKDLSYDSYSISGLSKDERNIVLLVSSKSNTSPEKVKKIYLTDYVNKGFLGSTPYLVKLSQDRFIVLWEEFVYNNDGVTTVDKGVRYIEVDGNGQTLTEIKSLPNMKLSSDCQPIVLNNQIVWYVNTKSGRMFYQIPI